MSEQVRVWQPSDRDGTLLSALPVPFQGLHMTQAKYESLLESYMRTLIDHDPEQAREVLTGSVEHNPNLYEIASSTSPEDWPAQIMTCDQMQMRLARIDFQQGETESLPPEQLPSLQEIVETI